MRLSLHILGTEVFALRWQQDAPAAPTVTAAAAQSAGDDRGGSGLGGVFERGTVAARTRPGFGFKEVT